MKAKIYNELNGIPDDYVQEHLKHTLGLIDEKNLLKLHAIINRFISIIPEELSSIQKAAILYEVVTRRTHYSDSTNYESSFVFVSALLSQKAVCMGIAELYSILCTWIGIPNITIIGYAWKGCDISNGSLHAWNMIKVKEQNFESWFHCDPTWDLKENNSPSNMFFLKNDEYMHERNHLWIKYKYPICFDNFNDIVHLNEEGVSLICRFLEQVIASI